MAKISLVILVFTFLSPIPDTHEDHIEIAYSQRLAAVQLTSLEVGDLIQDVIAGSDYVGQELVIRGVVLSGNASGSGVINLGTRLTYESGNYENFLSIYSSQAAIGPGRTVEILVEISTSNAVSIGGNLIVTIEAEFRDCLSC